MKAINVRGEVKIYNSIPKKWNNISNYDILNREQHYNDGWRDFVYPKLNNQTKLGELYYDGENNLYTHYVLNKTNEENTIFYKYKIQEYFSHLYIRSLASSMNKSNLELNFLTAQREEYQDKYDVAKGIITSGTRYDNTLGLIQGEMLDEFSETVLDSILPTLGVTPEGDHLNKMYQLIIVRFEYGRNMFDNFMRFTRRFRTKSLLWVDNNEWDKLDLGFEIVDNLPSELTLEQVNQIYNEFNLI